MLHFQNKVIHFTLTNMFSFDVKIIESKKEDVKIKPSEKWNCCELIPLHYMLHVVANWLVIIYQNVL